MSRRAGHRGRVTTVLLWPVGMAFTAWRYLWRITPLHRSDQQDGDPVRPPSMPEVWDDDRLQPVAAGCGALHWRRYHVLVEGARSTPEALIEAIAANPNRAAPVEVAVFRKTRGTAGALRPGDEFVVRMPGPWDGPVRVVDVRPKSFRLATLAGHLEAGQIEFRACAEGDLLRFEIESWTRSGNRLVGLLYDRVRLVKEMQLHMWTHYCEQAARLSGGKLRGGVHVHTTRCRALHGPSTP